jgi:pimeloyl-ACP methyl ester carboxylesterase
VLDLPTVQIAYLDDGPEQGPLLVALHGFPDGWRSFRHQVAPLVAAGFRVVRPALRGYAPSSLANDLRYDPAALAEDALALGAALSPSRPFTLVGHDWGAVAAWAAAARAPERLHRLVALAVPHLGAAWRGFLRPAQLRRSWYMGLFQLPHVAERRLAAERFELVKELWRSWSPALDLSTPELTRELEEIIAGFSSPERTRAVLAYYRSLRAPRTLLGDSRRLLWSRPRVPTLYLHGADDGCIGPELVSHLDGLLPAGSEVACLEGVGHFLHQERPAEVNRRLLDWLAPP